MKVYIHWTCNYTKPNEDFQILFRSYKLQMFFISRENITKFTSAFGLNFLSFLENINEF